MSEKCRFTLKDMAVEESRVVTVRHPELPLWVEMELRCLFTDKGREQHLKWTNGIASRSLTVEDADEFWEYVVVGWPEESNEFFLDM